MKFYNFVINLIINNHTIFEFNYNKEIIKKGLKKQFNNILFFITNNYSTAQKYVQKYS